jgi:hypothetical protein
MIPGWGKSQRIYSLDRVNGIRSYAANMHNSPHIKIPQKYAIRSASAACASGCNECSVGLPWPDFSMRGCTLCCIAAVCVLHCCISHKFEPGS